MTLFRSILTVLMIAFSGAAFAQEDDKDYLTRLLQSSLSAEGRTVEVNGFRGAFSSEATIEQITFADAEGVWLELSDVSMKWSRTALLRGELSINKLAAQSIRLDRFPVAQKGLPAAEATQFALPDLPVSVNIDTLEVDEIAVGAAILGEAVSFQMTAALMLNSAVGKVTLDAVRTDGKVGAFHVDSGFEAEGEVLSLDITLDEGAGGVTSHLLNLPAKPSVNMAVKGQGALDDFSADIRVATNDVERLGGQVRLLAVEATDGTGASARKFEAAIDGDVTALFAPQYQEFFGDNLQVRVVGERASDGSLDLAKLELKTQEFVLRGSSALNSAMWPTKVDLTARLAGNDGVLLPLSGEMTTVNSGRLQLAYDQAKGNDWVGSAQLDGLRRDDVQVEQISLAGGGTLESATGSLGEFFADLTFDARGLKFADTAISKAVGDGASGSLQLGFSSGSPLELPAFEIRTSTAVLTGNAVVSSLSDGFKTDFETKLQVSELRGYSDLIGQEIKGATDATLKGNVALGGGFDLALQGSVTDLSISQDQVDQVLRGKTIFDVTAERDTSGIVIRGAKIENDQLSASASGRIASDDAALSYAFRLGNVATFVPSVSGAATVVGTANLDAEGWRVVADAKGPYSSVISASGRVTGNAPSVRYSANIPDVRPLAPQLSGPLSIDGTAQQKGADWQIQTALQGVQGTQATVDGTIKSDGSMQLKAVGSAPLALSEPFVSPLSLQGRGAFDVSINGAPSLGAIKGRVWTQNARAVMPELPFSLDGISANVTLDGGRAVVDVKTDISSGGRVSVSGPIGLTNGMIADLAIKLQAVKIVDPNLYSTSMDGALALTGNLQGGGQISGQIDLGQTDISVPSSSANSFSSLPAIRHVGAKNGVITTQKRAGLAGAVANNSSVGPSYGLNLLISAPSRVFVRGRGIDAELGGRLRLGGTTKNVTSAGRFELVRGRLDVLEKRFVLDEGTVQLQGDMDPYLRFVATTTTDDGSASIILQGLSSSLELTFESVPEAPQDEVLAQIYFGRSIEKLSPFQALQLVSAVATLAGKGGQGIVSRLRGAFSLDDLDVGTDDDGNVSGTAGKYISDNIYSSVTAGTDEASVSLNIDLTPSITARGTITSDSESKIGIFFERDY